MPKPFDLLREFSKFGAERNISLRDPDTKSAFGLHVASEMELALADPILLQGQRAEAMFEALVVSLGHYRIIKPEDGGRVHPAIGYRTPDFRVVLQDGSNWLVEVKNVFEADPRRQRRKLMTKRYREELEAYAEATGGELKLAIYWARWSIWTVVTPKRLVGADGDLTLDMMTAAKVNELGSLGDLTLGTRPPLELRLTMDPARTSPIGADGTVLVTIGRAQIFCGNAELTDPVEQQLAWTLMNYGEWQLSGPDAAVDGDRLDAIVFRWEPEEDHDQGFEMIGSLSRIFARYFAEQTMLSGAVTQLRAPVRPEWFEPLRRWQDRDRSLPLWRFMLQPNYDGLAVADHRDSSA